MTLITEYRWDAKAETRPDILAAWRALGADAMRTVSWLAFKQGWLAHESRGYLKGSTATVDNCDCTPPPPELKHLVPLVPLYQTQGGDPNPELR